MNKNIKKTVVKCVSGFISVIAIYTLLELLGVYIPTQIYVILASLSILVPIWKH